MCIPPHEIPSILLLTDVVAIIDHCLIVSERVSKLTLGILQIIENSGKNHTTLKNLGHNENKRKEVNFES